MDSIPFVSIGPNRQKVCPLIQVHYSPPAGNDPDRGEKANVLERTATTSPTVVPFKPRIVP